MAGQATFRIGEADHLAAVRAVNRRHLRSRRFLSRMAILIGVAAVSVAIFGMTQGDDAVAAAVTAAGGIAGGAIGLAILIAIGQLLLPRRARRLYRQHRQLQQAVTARWSDAGLEWESPSGNNRLAWQDIHAWGDNRGAVLVYLTDILVHIIPAHALSPAAHDDLVATLRRHIGDRR